MKKSTRLREAIMARRAVVVPGCHDAMSAKIIGEAEFEAVQISGFGVAASLLAKPDVGLVQMKDVLDTAWNIVQAAAVPVMVDADTGGGNAVNARWVTERFIAMGAAGMNIEDQVFPKRCGHMAGKQVVPAEEMIGKVRACAEVRDRMDEDFVINARTDAFAAHGLDEAIRRGNLYLDAGADLVFIDAIAKRGDIERAVKEVGGPLSVNLMDGVTGVKTEMIPVPELAAMGVARVSIPVASIMVAYKALKAFFEALRASPAGNLADRPDWVPSFEQFTDFIGMKEYRTLENAYLPDAAVEEKYRATAG